MTHYIIFGDSIGLGEGDPVGGWVKKLSQKYSVENLSLDGATTKDLLNHFPSSFNPQTTFIIALGVNDSIFLSLTQFNQNLIQLIKLAQKSTQKIILIGPALVDELKVNPIPWEPNYSYLNESITRFNQTIAEICSKKKLKFIDLFHQLPPDYIKTLDDGVHPNHAGHKMIFDIIKNNL
ncbi:MAG: SGNH/GDSL hydrolase family protein [Candidatus Beckwithbacteria bacterium]